MAFRALIAPTLLIALAATSGPAGAQISPQYRPLPPIELDDEDDEVEVLPPPAIPRPGVPGALAAPTPGPGERGPVYIDQFGRRIYPVPRESAPTVLAPPGFIFPDDDRRRLPDPSFRPDPRDTARAAPRPGDEVIRPPAPIGPPVVTAPSPPGPSQQMLAALPPDEQPETEVKELPPHLKRQMVDYPSREPVGTIVIDTPNTYLYLILGGGKAMRYGIGVGREGFTWSGNEKISKMAEWPDWHPPAEMIERQPYLPRFMAGGEGNPLGARALYLGRTLYRIHGTNQPSTIGTFVSSGCVRLTNEDVIDLYMRAKVGAKVVVLPGNPPATTAANAPVNIAPAQSSALPPAPPQSVPGPTQGAPNAGYTTPSVITPGAVQSRPMPPLVPPAPIAR